MEGRESMGLMMPNIMTAGGKVGYDGQESGNGCDTAEV